MNLSHKKYRHLFFDLDRTLWDFESNSIVTLNTIFKEQGLFNIFPDFEVFIEHYKRHNEILWDLYRRGLITKDKLRNERFLRTLQEFSCDDEKLARNIGDAYIKLSPKQTGLFPGTIETLEYLKEKYF